MILYPSLSARRAWIEIARLVNGVGLLSVALRKESVDRNRTPHHKNTKPIPSLSARRAWIEIYDVWADTAYNLSLSARRAWIEINVRSQPSRPRAVALRKESVDRNYWWVEGSNLFYYVALRKESVDRNSLMVVLLCHHISVALRKESVDRNRCQGHHISVKSNVALRKESVDRNKLCHAQRGTLPDVALRKESVDRNIYLTQKHKG